MEQFARESHSDGLARGQEALARGDWQAARLAFEAVVRDDPTPEGWEGLGLAAWFLQDASTTLDARQRAYRLFRARGDDLSAARMATWLAMDFMDFRSEPAVSNGWTRRAERLLAGLPPAREHGWLRIWQAHQALMEGQDPDEARRLASEAVEAGRSSLSLDVEMLGQALRGLAEVSSGSLEGMSRLDEAVAVATSGEVTDPNAVGYACCYLIQACEHIRDYDRAAQWCEHVREYCTRWRFDFLFTSCRLQYATILTYRGEWRQAEDEIEAAMRELSATRPQALASGRARLAELRRRQGRHDEAEELLESVQHHPLAVLVRAELALDRGQPSSAEDFARQHLRRLGTAARTRIAPVLELLVHAQAASGAVGDARGTLEQLESISGRMGSDTLRAGALSAAASVATAEDDHERARTLLEDAADLYQRGGTPYEAARARLRLARTLATLGRRDRAAQAAGAALAVFRGLGAAAEVVASEALLRELEREANPSGRGPANALTPREREVLRLVAEGLGDKEIAARLFISEHTVHRHVSNIRTKLGEASRAAAVAHALRERLI